MRRRISIILVPILCAHAVPIRAQSSPTEAVSVSTTLAQFDPLEEAGSIQINDVEILGQLGYDPSRSWEAGDPAHEALQLGDLNDLYTFEDLTVGDSLANAGRTPENTTLGEFPLAQQQTIGDLIQNNPELVNLSVSSVPAFESLLSGDFDQSLGQWHGFKDFFQPKPDCKQKNSKTECNAKHMRYCSAKPEVYARGKQHNIVRAGCDR